MNLQSRDGEIHFIIKKAHQYFKIAIKYLFNLSIEKFDLTHFYLLCLTFSLFFLFLSAFMYNSSYSCY